MVLSSRMPDLEALEVLLAVARAGSFNVAATELGVSQQAVSARISSLERLLGVSLLTRSTKGSELTTSGALVAEWAHRLIDAAAVFDTAVATLRADEQRTLRVSASLTVAEQLLPGWLVSLNLAAAASSRPPVEVILNATNSGHVIDDVRTGRSDVGFIETPSGPRGLRTRVVAADELVLVARPDHRFARRRRPVGAQELGAEALVTREAGSGTREALDAALRRALGPDFVPTRPVLALSTTSAVRGAVLAGAGAAVLSELAVRDDVANQRLVRIPVEGLELRRQLRAVWSGTAAPPAGPVRDLLGHIAALG